MAAFNGLGGGAGDGRIPAMFVQRVIVACRREDPSQTFQNRLVSESVWGMDSQSAGGVDVPIDCICEALLPNPHSLGHSPGGAL